MGRELHCAYRFERQRRQRQQIKAAIVKVGLKQPVEGKQAYGPSHYLAIFDPAQAGTYQVLFQGIVNSLIICVITVIIVLVILLPTMLLVELRFPKLRRTLEFVCIIPITIQSQRYEMVGAESIRFPSSDSFEIKMEGWVSTENRDGPPVVLSIRRCRFMSDDAIAN